MNRTALSLAIAVAMALILLTSPAHSQYTRQNKWRTYSALNAVQGVVFQGDSILWGATTGGLVMYHVASDSFEVFRNTEGLLSLNSTALAVDSSTGDLYVGSADGSISIRRRDGSWAYSNVIATATEYPERKITGFGFHNGRVFVTTSFGGIVYNPADSTVTDNFVNLGSIPRNTAVNDILFWKDSIWLATDKGITRTSITNDNLAARERWQTYPGTESYKVLSLTVLDGKLMVGTRTQGAFQLETATGVITPRSFDLPSGRIRLDGEEESTVAASEFVIYRFKPGTGFVQVATTGDEIQAIGLSSSGEIAVGMTSMGFGMVKTDGLIVRMPNAPVSNTFNDIALSADGTVWTTHIGYGVSHLVQGAWQIFTPRTTGIPSMSNHSLINAGAGSMIWASATGTKERGGVNSFNPVDTGVVITHYDNSNSPITDIVDIADYISTGDVAADLSGNIWIVNTAYGEASGPLFVVKPAVGPGETNGFLSFIPPLSATSNRSFRRLAIDDNGTKWAGGAPNNKSRGLLYFNDRGTLQDAGEAEWGLLTPSDGLPDIEQSALVVDPDGLLWIGTPKGLTVLVNPVSVVNNNQRPDFRPVRLLNDVKINAIAVDALNRKWVGTDQGVFVLNLDGTEVVERYTKANSPLVDDAVLSILADDATGDVYIGTINGMSRVSTPAVESPEEISGIRVYPQPLILPAAEPLRIEGLPGGATVKILHLSGSLVREVLSPGGGVAFWDGTDQGNKTVPSGIYLIAAGSSVSDQTVVGKIAVIRR